MAVQNKMFLLLREIVKNRPIKYFNPSLYWSQQISISAASGTMGKISKAMEIYMKNAQNYDEYMQQQIKEFENGKKYLANMMGKDHRKMTQEDIDNAIDYLFPSNLFVPKARPMMKSPEVISETKKGVQFDFSGRPFHFLFYTGTPNYCEILHDAASKLKELDRLQSKELSLGLSPPSPLSLPGSVWITHKELENVVNEKLFPIEYNKFIEVFEALLNHPYSKNVENIIKSYRKMLERESSAVCPVSIVDSDGSLIVTVPKAARGLAVAEVIVKYPGEGWIKINGEGIDYFHTIPPREQVSFKTLIRFLFAERNIMKR